MGKQSFILYDNWKPLINALSDEEAGILLKAVYCYRETGEISPVPATVNPTLQFVINTLQVDEEKYKKRCEQNKKNRVGGRNDND